MPFFNIKISCFNNKNKKCWHHNNKISINCLIIKKKKKVWVSYCLILINKFKFSKIKKSGMKRFWFLNLIKEIRFKIVKSFLKISLGIMFYCRDQWFFLNLIHMLLQNWKAIWKIWLETKICLLMWIHCRE